MEIIATIIAFLGEITNINLIVLFFTSLILYYHLKEFQKHTHFQLYKIIKEYHSKDAIEMRKYILEELEKEVKKAKQQKKLLKEINPKMHMQASKMANYYESLGVLLCGGWNLFSRKNKKMIIEILYDAVYPTWPIFEKYTDQIYHRHKDRKKPYGKYYKKLYEESKKLNMKTGDRIYLEFKEMFKKKKLLLIIAFLLSTLFWYSFIFEPNNIQVEKISIEIENLPKEFEGTKIVHLTDFHSKDFGEREKRVLEILEDINPDFIFITGDFIDHSTKNLDSCQKFWRELSSQHQGKIFGVLGNHEHWIESPDISAMKSLLEESGISILNNENRKIFRDEKYIYLLGVDDPDSEKDDLPKAMINTEKNIPKILLAHSPDIIDNLQGEKVDLILVGHTHGGQVVIPFIRSFWVPTKNRGKYASGLFGINDTILYVNRGVGLAPVLPIRFNCPPEIAVIELKRKN